MSVDINIAEAEVTFDEQMILTIKVKDEFAECGFQGEATVKLRVSTGIERKEDDFNRIIKQNRFTTKFFKVKFVGGDCGKPRQQFEDE